MLKTLAIQFHLRKHKRSRDTEATIYLIIKIDGKRVDFTTNRNIHPGLWDHKFERAMGVKEEIKILYNYLQSLYMSDYYVTGIRIPGWQGFQIPVLQLLKRLLKSKEEYQL